MKLFKVGFLSLVCIAMCNIGTAQASNYEKVLWLSANGHEAGDNEPSDACYLTFHNDTMVMHWITMGDPESIDIYKITKKDKNSFCATPVGEYYIDGAVPNGLEKQESASKQVCGKFAGDRLVLKDWITLKRVKLKITGE